MNSNRHSWICFALMVGCILGAARNGAAQVSGNAGFNQSGNGAKIRASQNERSRHVLTEQELPPGPNGMFVEANVLMNVKADEYVAVFGISKEGATVQECADKMDAAVKQFTTALRSLSIPEMDIFVDFITQPRTYGFEFTGDIAREKLTGFELKKNVSVHFSDRDLIDRLVVVAANQEIYDLIKVDYIVKDVAAIQQRLMQEVSVITKEKIASYEQLLGIKVQQPAQVYAQRSGVHYPTELYDSYVAAETEGTQSPASRYTVQRARKGRTFYFNGLDSSGFDKVINPVILEPVVQFTLYLKVRYSSY